MIVILSSKVDGLGSVFVLRHKPARFFVWRGESTIAQRFSLALLKNGLLLKPFNG